VFGGVFCEGFDVFLSYHQIFMYFGIQKFTCQFGKSSESVQCAMLKACDACADMGQL